MAHVTASVVPFLPRRGLAAAQEVSSAGAAQTSARTWCRDRTSHHPPQHHKSARRTALERTRKSALHYESRAPPALTEERAGGQARRSA
ncbi:hypothetical protein QJS66_17150 [Kocuria rhizophila]|nr:hypothetical protein QJS66_17150 [Kocuria rhizophila]